MATRIAVRPRPNVRLPQTSMRAGERSPISRRLAYDQIVPRRPNGTETKNTRRQSTSESSPPAIRPMNDPAMAATWLMPIAMPRRSGGKASVRMAAEFANSMAAPTPCTTRQMISQRDGCRREDGEAHAVNPNPTVDVAQASHAHDQDSRDQEKSHNHPQQIADIAVGERIDVNAAEDGR